MEGDLHFPGWPHGSFHWFRDYDVGFFTSSLASYIESLRSWNRSFICASWQRLMTWLSLCHATSGSEVLKSELRDAYLLLLPPACVHDCGGSSASAAFPLRSCWCIRMSQCVHPYAVNNVRAWVSAPHAQTVSPASTDSLAGCARLAANGAEVCGRCPLPP